MSAPIELVAWHWAGGLLSGAYACPASVPRAVTDERVRRVVEAVIAVAYVDQVWPVDLGRVVDVLRALEAFDEIGGGAFLIELMSSWSERIDRARYLGAMLAFCQIAHAAIDDELATNDQLAALIDRRCEARERAELALTALRATEEAA